MRDAKVIRVRDRKGGATDSYLEITSESGLRGYAGPLLKEQAAAFPANLRELLAGRDAADPDKLNFATLWAACHPGNASRKLRPWQRPADRRDGVGHQAQNAPLRDRLGDHGLERDGPGPLGPARQGGRAARLALLRAKRQRLNAYASMLGYSVKPTEAARWPASSSIKGSRDRSGSS